MKILIISTLDTVPWGGSEVLWANAASHLRDSGDDVLVLRRMWPTSPEPVARLISRGVRFVPLIDRYGSGWRERWHRWSRRFRRVTYERRELSDAVRDFSPDLVLVSQAGQYDGVEWLKACAALRLRYAVLAQVAVDAWWPAGEMIQHLHRGFEEAARCFFVSEANRALTRLQLAAGLERSEIVWNPFAVEFDSVPIWPESETPLRLACVARLEPGSKGQDLLFRVLAAPKWRARAVVVSLFGSGAQEEVLRAAARREALDAVTFGGQVRDMAAVWRDHHALILPSRVEGMPLAAIEAMLCHRPCIVTDAGGNAELVEDGVTGCVAAGASVRALDEALERFWQQRATWQAMGRRAGERVRALVPRDPGRQFAERLREVARNSGG